MVATRRISKFCFFFSLRQGAVCVAVTELTLAAFSLLLLVLGAERAQEIANEAAANMAESDANSGSYFFNDGPVIHRGQQLANVISFLLYGGVVLVTTHLLTCLLLLHGAVKGIARFMLPWIYIVLISLIICSTFMFIFAFLPYRGCKLEIAVLSFVLILFEFHSWIVVCSYYRELMSIAACRLANNILANYDLMNPVQHPRVDI